MPLIGLRMAAAARPTPSGLRTVTLDLVFFFCATEPCQHGTQQQALVCLRADYLAGLPQRRLGNLGQVGPNRSDIERAGYLAGDQLARPYLEEHWAKDIVGGNPPA